MNDYLSFTCCYLVTRNAEVFIINGPPTCNNCGKAMLVTALPPGNWLAVAKGGGLVTEGTEVVICGELRNMPGHYIVRERDQKIRVT